MEIHFVLEFNVQIALVITIAIVLRNRRND